MKNQEQKTILLVEDDTATMMVEAHLLKSFGYDVVTAKSGEEAVQIVAGSDQVDLVLMDIELGAGMDGAEAARQILLKRHLPIVFLSSHSEKEYVARVKGVAGYGYVIKNSGDVVLQSSIEMALNLFKSQEALRESERSLAITFSSIGDAVVATDARGCIVRMNRVAEQLTGWPLAEARGRPLDEVFHIVNQHTRQPVENPVAKVLETGKIQGLANDTMLISRQGAERIIADSAAAIVNDETKQTVGVVLVFRDVTETYAVQRQMKIRNRAIETSIDAIAFSDPKGILTYVNPVFLRMWGLIHTDEALGKPAKEFWQVQEKAEAVMKALETQGGWEGELTARRKDGSLFDAQLSSSIVKDEGGRILCMMASFKDITARKRSEDARQKSEAKYKKLAENIPQKIFIKDRNLVYLSCNENYARDLKIKAEEIIEKTDFDFYPEELAKKYRDDDKKILESGKTTELKEKYIQDGKEFIVQTIKTPVKDEQDNVVGILGIFWDITARKRAEEEVRELNATLEQRVQERTAELEAFAYSISHDLRAPLRAIDSFARIMTESHSVHVGKEGHHCLTVIQDNCRQMDRLIQGLLTFSRLSRQPLNKQKTDIHDLVNSVLKDFNAERKERGVKIVLGHLPSCEADPVLLRQVFFNLISNAIKFTRQCKEARVEIGSRQEENRCEYFIRDNGVGFDMQYVHKLFNVFARLHRSEDYEGTGVGLAIAQRIIQRHGGRVRIESEVNKGTTVYFTLA